MSLNTLFRLHFFKNYSFVLRRNINGSMQAHRPSFYYRIDISLLKEKLMMLLFYFSHQRAIRFFFFKKKLSCIQQLAIFFFKLKHNLKILVDLSGITEWHAKSHKVPRGISYASYERLHPSSCAWTWNSLPLFPGVISLLSIDAALHCSLILLGAPSSHPPGLTGASEHLWSLGADKLKYPRGWCN